MAETSYFWDGLVTGDAILSPYSSDLWHTLWQTMFSRGVNEGVLNGVDNELAVSGVAGGASVATGKALVDGTLYESSSAVSVTIATPVTDPRIDRIVIRKDWSTKTIRIALLGGTENASPTAPALTQTAGSIWEIPLAQALITTAGVITVTDEIENARTRLAPSGAGISMIETFTATGIESSIDFTAIPDTFQHLFVIGNILSSIGSANNATIRINGDATAGNYNRQVFGRSAGGVVAGANVGTILPPLNTVGDQAIDAFHSTQLEIQIQNYKDVVFYKSIIQKESANQRDTATFLNITTETILWLNTVAINRITIVPAGGGTIEVGTVITLFGVD